MDKSKSFSLFKDYLEYMEGMSDEDLGKAMRAVWLYENGMELPELSGMAWMLFTTIRRDLDRAHAISQVRSENGAKGGKSKAEASDEEAPVSKEEANSSKHLANASKREASSSKPSLHKTLDIDKDITPPTPLGGDEGGGTPFERFWEAYPKKVRKAAARRAWKAIKPDEDLTQTILKAIELAKASPQWTKSGGRFIPDPSRWIEEKRWEDQLSPALEPPRSYNIEDLERISHFDLPDKL